MTCILEGRPGPGLFWIVPMKGRSWILMLFSEHSRKFDDHGSLWREVVANTILNHFQITDTAKIDKFKELFDAFPRGRLEVSNEIGKWLVGFGGDFPTGWDENKLLERLKILRQDTEIEYDDHWIADPTQKQFAMQILGIQGIV
jgi:hypothetical protein